MFFIPYLLILCGLVLLASIGIVILSRYNNKGGVNCYVRELWPLEKDFYVEAIGFGNSGKHHSLIGLHQFNYCNENLMRRGFKYNGQVGVWEEYDRSGKLLKRTDYGNMDKLDRALHALNY